MKILIQKSKIKVKKHNQMRVQQQINAKTIIKNYQINLYTHMQKYKHFEPMKGNLKVVFELLLKFRGAIL